MRKFGQYLVENNIIDEDTMIQALGIQRRRKLIHLGEIALQKRLINSKQLFAILNRQDDTGERFGDVAISLGFLNQEQVNLLVQLQETIHETVGSIVVELNKASQEQIDSAWKDYCAEVRDQSHNETKIDGKEFQLEQSVLFQEFKQHCPICHHEEKQRLIDPHLVKKVKHDIDLKPSEYKWEKPYDKASINPLLYDSWTCQECGFTANHRYFQSLTRECSISPLNLSKKIMHVCSIDSTYTEIVKVKTIPENDFSIAIKYFMQAIYIFSHIPAIADKDALPLANHCHHLAWLYRDLKTAEASVQQAATAVIDSLVKICDELPSSESEALEKALNYYETAYYESKIVERDGFSHIIKQVMARINIQCKNFKEAEIELKEASKIVEFEIQVLNSKIESVDIPKETRINYEKEKSKLSGFLMDTIELFKYLEV